MEKEQKKVTVQVPTEGVWFDRQDGPDTSTRTWFKDGQPAIRVVTSRLGGPGWKVTVVWRLKELGPDGQPFSSHHFGPFEDLALASQFADAVGIGVQTFHEARHVSELAKEAADAAKDASE